MSAWAFDTLRTRSDTRLFLYRKRELVFRAEHHKIADYINFADDENNSDELYNKDVPSPQWHCGDDCRLFLHDKATVGPACILFLYYTTFSLAFSTLGN